MIFEWDEKKNQQNILKHGFDFERAKTIFNGITFDKEDIRKDYDEKRVITVGLMEGIAIIVVTHTDRNGVTRIISARPANRKERKIYETHTSKNRC